MATQNAVALTKIASPLTAIKLPIPTPKDNEVLLKLTATGIAPLDQKLRDLNLFNIASRLPAILTFDLVGTIHSHSPTLPSHLSTKFPIGTHVMAQGNVFSPFGGGLQEYTVVDARFAAVVPEKLEGGDTEAALWPINGFTSFAGLFSNEGEKRGLGIRLPTSLLPNGGKVGELGEGEGNPYVGSVVGEGEYRDTAILIVGGSSRCGQIALQFAKMAGFEKVLTTASKNTESEKFLMGLGASHVFDRHLSEEELEREIRAVVGDELTLIYDTMTTSDFSFVASLLSSSKPAYLAHLLHGKVENEEVLKGKDVKEWQTMGVSAAHPHLAAIFWEKIGEWVEGGLTAGGYKVIEGGLADLEGINGALDGFKSGSAERWHVRIL